MEIVSNMDQNSHEIISTNESKEISNYLITRNCPACGSIKFSPKVQAENPGETSNFENLEKRWYGFYEKSMFFTFMECEQCHLLFCNKYFSNEALEHLYSNMPDNTYGEDINNMISTQNGYFQMLSKEDLSLSGSYLELGPDIGLFTRNIAQKCNFDNHYLIEPNLKVHEELKKSMNGKKHQILTDLFDYSAIPDNSLALVVMIHVLDHVLEPKEMLSILNSKMKKDGRILIVTHNEKSLLPKILKNRWPAYCLQHPQLYSPPTITSLLERTNFGTVIVNRSKNYFTLAFLLTHLFWSLKLGKFQFKLFEKITLPLRLGNIITKAVKT